LSAKVFCLIPPHMDLKSFDLITRERRSKFPHFSRSKARDMESLHIVERLRSPAHGVMGILKMKRTFPLRELSCLTGEELFLALMRGEEWARVMLNEQMRRRIR
jgi:hypothetical protein